MKNRHDLNRILMLLLLLAAFNIANAQTEKKNYRWQKQSLHEVSSTEEQPYRNLPEVDYTPDQHIEEWSTANELKQFAANLPEKKVIVRTILKIDEKGYVRSVKLLSSNSRQAADALIKLLVNTKVSGPSYVHNEAVTANIPCTFSINNKQISIL